MKRLAEFLLLIGLCVALAEVLGCTSGEATDAGSSVASSSITTEKPSSSTTEASSPTTTVVALTGAKAELYGEIQRIREGLESGTLAFDWYPPGVTASELPADPVLFLEMLEQSLFNPDVTLYLLGSAGEAGALRAEIAVMPEVARLVCVSREDALARVKEQFKDNPEVIAALEENQPGEYPAASLEIWLRDYTQAESFADSLAGRSEVDEVRAFPPHMDYAGWTARLRSLTRPVIPGGTRASTGPR